MNSTFRPDELITKKGKTYPVVGARLRLAHENNDSLEIITNMISFEVMDQAVVKAQVKTDKGQYSAYGVASASKDTRLVDSLLELAETRSIARALRFAGYGVEYTGIEEIGDAPAHQISEVKTTTNGVVQDPISKSQRRAIETIASSKHWNALEAAKRILRRKDLQNLDDLSKGEAIQVISRFKEQMAA